VSLALMLMVVAGLLARTVIAMQQLELGFDPDNVLSMAIDIPDAKYPGDHEQRQFFQQIMSAVEGLPAVASVALATGRPAIDGGATRAITVEGQPPVDDAGRPDAQFITTSPNYFDLFGIPVVQGRSFLQNDDEDSFRVAVVSQEAARRFWPNDDPVGQRIRIGLDESAEWVQVVGIVRDVRSSNGESELPDPQIFLPFDQNPRAAMVVMVRSKGDPSALAGPVRTQVWAIDPGQPVDDVRTMEQALYDDQSTGYALITLFVAFAVFALCMAGVGIYGVMSYAVSQRASEISIRLALGAKAGDVRMMVLRQGGKLIVLGGAAGLVGAVLISRLLSGLVFGISTLDPVTFVGVPTVLMSIGLLANYIPARRATQIDPMKAMRVE
jgi:putative ABC transport system permease protein